MVFTMYIIYDIITIVNGNNTKEKEYRMKAVIEFYRTKDGREPLAEFLDSLPTNFRAKALWELDLLAEKGQELREPYVKHIEGELWELRIKFASNISRIFYFIPYKTKIVLLHGFVKKTRRTPAQHIRIAKERLKDYKRGVYSDFRRI